MSWAQGSTESTGLRTDPGPAEASLRAGGAPPAVCRAEPRAREDPPGRIEYPRARRRTTGPRIRLEQRGNRDIIFISVQACKVGRVEPRRPRGSDTQGTAVPRCEGEECHGLEQ